MAISLALQKRFDLAQSVSREVGVFLMREFQKIANGTQLEVEDKGAMNTVSWVDMEAEKQILTSLQGSFQEDAFHAEESGKKEGSGYQWYIDPLDGTNNFSRGLPMFGISIGCLERESGRGFAVIYLPVLDSLTTAITGEGATHNGVSIEVRANNDDTLKTIGIVAGYQSPIERDAKIRAHFLPKVGRLLGLWCPSMDFVRFAQGYTDVIISLENEVYDQWPGLLIAKEAGCAVKTLDGEDIGLQGVGDLYPIVVMARSDRLYNKVVHGLQDSDL